MKAKFRISHPGGLAVRPEDKASRHRSDSGSRVRLGGRLSELLSRPWWLGLGVLVAAAVAFSIYFLSLGGTQSGNGAQPADRTSVPATPKGAADGSGQHSTPDSGSSDGTLLGSYGISLLPNYNVVLNSTKPSFSQFIPAGDECDSGNLCAGLNNGGFSTNTGTTLLGLPGGSTPTYQSCKDAEPMPSARDTAQTSFCLVETGLMIGVTITSVDPAPPGASALQITVWRNLS
jgi:hypothetical protein